MSLLETTEVETTEVAGHISTTNSLPPSAEMQLWRRALWMFPALLQAKTTELAHTTTFLGLPEMRVRACIVSFHYGYVIFSAGGQKDRDGNF